MAGPVSTAQDVKVAMTDLWNGFMRLDGQVHVYAARREGDLGLLETEMLMIAGQYKDVLHLLEASNCSASSQPEDQAISNDCLGFNEAKMNLASRLKQLRVAADAQPALGGDLRAAAVAGVQQAAEAVVDAAAPPREPIILENMRPEVTEYVGNALDKLVDDILDPESGKFPEWRVCIKAWMLGVKVPVRWDPARGCTVQMPEAVSEVLEPYNAAELKERARARHLNNLVNLLMCESFFKTLLMREMNPPNEVEEKLRVHLDREAFQQQLAKKSPNAETVFKSVADGAFYTVLCALSEKNTLGIVPIVQNLSIASELATAALGLKDKNIVVDTFGWDDSVANRPTFIMNMAGDYAAKLMAHRPVSDFSCNFFPNQFEYFCHAGVADSVETVLPLDELVDELYRRIEAGESVLVHCREGRSRSAAVVIAYLIKYHDLSFDQAMQKFVVMRGLRAWKLDNGLYDGDLPNAKFQKQLQAFSDKYREARVARKMAALQQAQEEAARQEQELLAQEAERIRQIAAAEQEQHGAANAAAAAAAAHAAPPPPYGAPNFPHEEEGPEAIVAVTAPDLCAPAPPAAPITGELYVLRSDWDVKLGSTLFVRGEGAAGLSWNEGLPMVYDIEVGGWMLPISVTGPIKYKFLKNDTEWENGPNHEYSPQGA